METDDAILLVVGLLIILHGLFRLSLYLVSVYGAYLVHFC
jgi:hypothetical protein